MLPDIKDNPGGLHRKYAIFKMPKEGEETLQPIEPGSEYFVLRLDDGGGDPNHIYACRIAVHAYADAIEPFIPQLAMDIRRQWPLIKTRKHGTPNAQTKTANPKRANSVSQKSNRKTQGTVRPDPKGRSKTGKKSK